MRDSVSHFKETTSPILSSLVNRSRWTRPHANSVTFLALWLHSTLQASTRRESMTFTPCTLVLPVNMCCAPVLCPRMKPIIWFLVTAHPTGRHFSPLPHASQTWYALMQERTARLSAEADLPSLRAQVTPTSVPPAVCSGQPSRSWTSSGQNELAGTTGQQYCRAAYGVRMLALTPR